MRLADSLWLYENLFHGLTITLKELRENVIFTDVSSCSVPLGAFLHDTSEILAKLLQFYHRVLTDLPISCGLDGTKLPTHAQAHSYRTWVNHAYSAVLYIVSQSSIIDL